VRQRQEPSPLTLRTACLPPSGSFSLSTPVKSGMSAFGGEAVVPQTSAEVRV
jgi:hypothetical protein